MKKIVIVLSDDLNKVLKLINASLVEGINGDGIKWKIYAPRGKFDETWFRREGSDTKLLFPQIFKISESSGNDVFEIEYREANFKHPTTVIRDVVRTIREKLDSDEEIILMFMFYEDNYGFMRSLERLTKMLYALSDREKERLKNKVTLVSIRPNAFLTMSEYIILLKELIKVKIYNVTAISMNHLLRYVPYTCLERKITLVTFFICLPNDVLLLFDILCKLRKALVESRKNGTESLRELLERIDEVLTSKLSSSGVKLKRLTVSPCDRVQPCLARRYYLSISFGGKSELKETSVLLNVAAFSKEKLGGKPFQESVKLKRGRPYRCASVPPSDVCHYFTKAIRFDVNTIKRSIASENVKAAACVEGSNDLLGLVSKSILGVDLCDNGDEGIRLHSLFAYPCEAPERLRNKRCGKDSPKGDRLVVIATFEVGETPFAGAGYRLLLMKEKEALELVSDEPFYCDVQSCAFLHEDFYGFNLFNAMLVYDYGLHFELEGPSYEELERRLETVVKCFERKAFDGIRDAGHRYVAYSNLLKLVESRSVFETLREAFWSCLEVLLKDDLTVRWGPRPLSLASIASSVLNEKGIKVIDKTKNEASEGILEFFDKALIGMGLAREEEVGEKVLSGVLLETFLRGIMELLRLKREHARLEVKDVAKELRHVLVDHVLPELQLVRVSHVNWYSRG